MLADFKPQAALFVILGKLAQLRVLLGICQQTLFQVSIVGINFSKVIFDFAQRNGQSLDRN